LGWIARKKEMRRRKGQGLFWPWGKAPYPIGKIKKADA